MRRLSTLFVPLAAVCLVASACGGSTPSADSGQYAVDGTFTEAIPRDLGAFDPYRSNILGYGALAYDSLVNLRPDGSFVSGLARTWSADARQATFTLKSGVTCSDGAPLTAGDVAADITFVSNPKSLAKIYGVLTPTAPLTATGDDATGTVRVTVAQPFGFLLNTIGILPILCAKGLKDPSTLTSASDGTGPFVLTHVTPGQNYTFAVRKGYTWGPGGASTSAKGTPAKIVLRVITNQTTSANLLLANDLNIAQVGGGDMHRLDARGLKTVGYNVGVGVWFNQIGARATADERVREALERAVDRDQFVKVSTGGRGVPATGLLALDPKSCSGDTVAGQLPAHDVAAANTLLDQAGWTRGPDGVRAKNGQQLAIDLHYGTVSDPLDEPTAELVSQEWGALGVKVTLSGDDPTKLVDVQYKKSNWDTYVNEYGFSLPSQWIPYASGPIPPTGVNISGVNNARYSQLVAQANGMTPPTACTYWNDAEKALLRDVDFAPFAFRRTNYYLAHATAEFVAFQFPIPTSIRVFR